MSTIPHPLSGLRAEPATASASAKPNAPTRRVSSSELLGQDRELEIEHAGAVYRLRLTSLGKLILTK
jgi:hemin uptake protein HemP